MRLRLLTLLVVGCSIGAAGASVEQAQELFAELSARLELTSEQEAVVGPILREQGQEARVLMEGARGQGPEAFRALREQMSAIDSETDTRLAEHLSEEQLAQYKSWRTDNRARMRGRMMRVD